jgi:hypothetical protein
MAKVFSFDRDDTLALSSGPITLEMLRKLKEKGYVIGTGGGVSGEEQARQWTSWGIRPDFALTKSDLGKLRELYPGAEITHVGDDEVDEEIAKKCGYNYLTPEEFVSRLPQLIPTSFSSSCMDI